MPTVIDSLIVKLGLDSKDLDNKSGSAGNRLKDLEGAGKNTEGSIKKLGATSKDTSSSFETLAGSVGKFLAVLGGTYALKAFIEETIASNAALDRLSKNLGVSVEDISAWGNAVEELGGNAKGLQGSMAMLSQSQTELQLTGQSSLIPYFSALGVAMADVGGQARPVDKILLDLSERFSHMDRTTANNMGKMMGLDQDTLNLLLQGRHEVERTIARQKEFNAVSKAQAEQSAKLQKSIVDLKQSFTAMGRDLLQQASPAIEKMLGVLTSLGDWVKGNMEFIRDLGMILGVVAAGFAAISLAASPITLTVAAVLALAAGIALLWQDYQEWKRGGDSLIDWEKWKPGIDAAKAAILDLAKIVKESFGAIFQDVDAVQKLFHGDWKGAKKASDKSDDGVRAAAHTAAHAIMGVIKSVPATRQAIATANGQSVSSAYAMQYFQSRGLSAAAAAGLASQIHSESNGKVNAVGDSGKAFGLIQWHQDRQDNFKKFAGKDIRQSTADDQLSFMVHELMQGTERGAGNKLKAAGSAEEAGEIASKYYVRPRDREGEASKRGAYAAQISGIKGASSNVAAAGAPGSTSSNTSNDHSTTVTTGPITVHTAATNADGIVSDMSKSMNHLFTSQANSGLN